MSSLLIVAGEASGDLHGALLARELRRLTPEIQLFGAGGQGMRGAGVELVADPTRHAAVGVVEALQALGRYAALFRRLVAEARSRQPDAVVLIDLPDFNLRLAQALSRLGIPIIYYISPQIWAWRGGRMRTIARTVTKMIVIFDFELELYRKAGIDAVFVGHPFIDVIGDCAAHRGLRERLDVTGPMVGLLPASRKAQFRRLFPIFRETAARIRREVPGVEFVVACAPTIRPEEAALGGFPMHVVQDRTYEVMADSDLLLMASGTATVEAMIFGTPAIVAYRVSWASALLGRALIRVRHVAMPNILAGREVLPEFLQGRARPDLLAAEAIRLLRGAGLSQLRAELARLRERLGPPGAARRAALEVLRTAGVTVPAVGGAA